MLHVGGRQSPIKVSIPFEVDNELHEIVLERATGLLVPIGIECLPTVDHSTQKGHIALATYDLCYHGFDSLHARLEILR
jgi:hypothetical protein